ncbi:MAG TPA: HEAT repeat domain-containing protein [Acidimicrobiales bacterium]|nr:HEAT repeat domain-containing protein [Acidimicrobiales bacterium]
MLGDESTLAESIDESLLRASFAIGDDYIQVLRSNLESPVARHRILALRGIVRQRLSTTDDWRSALSDRDVDVRRDALNQIAHADIDDDEVFAAIVRCLDDDDALVVDGAVFALGEHLYVPAVVKLCEIATSHDDARCRESAIAALGAIGDDRARVVILAALTDKPPVRRRAIVALSNFEGPDIDEALERASQDRDWQVRAAVNQLGRDDD